MCECVTLYKLIFCKKKHIIYRITQLMNNVIK